MSIAMKLLCPLFVGLTLLCAATQAADDWDTRMKDANAALQKKRPEGKEAFFAELHTAL